MPWITVLGFCLALTVHAQAIRNIQPFGVTHSSIRWVFESDLPCVQVLYGTQSGVYPYSSNSFCSSDTRFSVSIGGLAPSTLYYFRIAARPNSTDAIGICQTDSCGSAEQQVTTEPAPAIHPALPEPPTSWDPQPPDTSQYFVVAMKNGGQNGTECVAAADVPEAGAHEGDGIESLLTEVPYGTVLEFPQGIQCVVPADRNAGYRLPAKPVDSLAGSIDSPQHRWIVLRTAPGKAGDLPPFGTRTDAEFAPKLAKFVAVKPTYWVTPSAYGKGQPQLFYADVSGQHHFWFENLEFTTTADPKDLPAPDALDPPPYSALFGTLPTFPETIPPDISYVVLDRIYLHGSGHPARYTRGVMLGGRYQAMLGCVLDDLDFWEIASPPQDPPLVAGATMTIPPVRFRKNSNSDPVGTQFPAIATLTASSDYTGQFLIQLGPATGGITVLYQQTGSTGTALVACVNCSAQTVETLTEDANAYRYCWGSIANSAFQLQDCALGYWQTTKYGYGWGTVGVELMDGGTGPYRIDNNLLGAVGMGFYVDAGGNAHDYTHNISYADNSNNDTVFTRNHVMWREDHRITSAQSNGYRYPVRNLFEVKRARRWKIEGNLFQNYWSFQNDGSALLFAGAAIPYAVTNKISGILDQEVSSNTIRHGAAGIEIFSALPGYSVGEQPGNFLIENNLIYDLAGRLKYSDGDPSLYTGPFAGGARDLTFRHNTLGMAWGDLPSILYADTSGAIMEGLSYTNNILYMNFGSVSGGVWINEGTALANFPRLPAIDRSTTKSVLGSAYIRAGSSVQPDYTFKDNVVVGGLKYKGAGEDPHELTTDEIQAQQNQFPEGNFFPWGNSLASRETEVGFTSSASNNFRLTSTSPLAKNGTKAAADGTAQGADLDRLESEQGLVTNIAPVTISSNQFIFRYTAPDSRLCAVDIGDGVQWTRTNDLGGSRDRLVSVPIEPVSRYRILCYYRQVNDGLRYTDYLPDQITEGVLPVLDGIVGRRRR